MYVHLGSLTESYEITEDDSLYFNSDQSIIYFMIDGILSSYNVSNIDSITFKAEVLDSTVYVTYNETTVSVINPLAAYGVVVDVDGADVVVHSTIPVKGIKYVLAGTTSNGMFKMYSDESFKMFLNGVNVTNSDWPAMNIQSGKKAYIEVVNGTTNSFTDGATYADPFIGDEGEEDQSAAFFSEGKIIFSGTGTLSINGNGTDQHALRSDDYIEINEATININSAAKDGLHGKDGVFINSGFVNVYSTGDGIDGDESVVEINGGEVYVNSTSDDVKAIKCDSTISINGGDITVIVSGDQSKGIDSKQSIYIYGGNIDISTSGSVVLEASGSGYDPSYCTAINADEDIVIGNAFIEINGTGAANKGISCDGNLYVNGSDITVVESGNGNTYTNESGENDSYHGSCINVDGDIEFLYGSIDLSHSGNGGKGISTDANLTIGGTSYNPELTIVTSGGEIVLSRMRPPGPNPEETDADEAKAIKADIAVTINSGIININSADDGIKADESITFNDGEINITQSYEGVEAPNITVNGGNISIFSSDDCFNATYGNGGEEDDGSLLSFKGGYAYISCTGGDALDSNGDIAISGGTIIDHGPASNVEVGMDYNGTCNVSGGYLVISAGNSNMLQTPSNSSSQYSVMLKSYSTLQAGTLIHIEDNSGNYILTFAPERDYSSLIFSSSALSSGTYKVYTGGTSSGTEENGLYTGGTYSGGTLKKTFTISGIVTTATF